MTDLGQRAARLVKLNALAVRIENRIVPSGLLEELEGTDTIDPKSLTIVDKYLTILETIRKETVEDKADHMQAIDFLAKFREFLISLRTDPDDMNDDIVKDEEDGDTARINGRAKALELETTQRGPETVDALQ